MNEQRRRERSPTNIPAHLISDQLDIACTVLDLSVTGARLQIVPGLFLPKHFVLRSNALGADRPVDVIWRNRTQMGVRFQNASAAARPAVALRSPLKGGR